MKVTRRLLSFILCLAGGSALAESQNPYLANSPWPMTHGNPGNSGSTSLPGPKLDNSDSSPLVHLQHLPVA